MRLYFAAPLFSDAERTFNEKLAVELRPYFDIYLPQEDGCLMAEMISRGVDRLVAAETVFRLDTIAINKCDVLVIVLDGRAVDEGAAFELGYAFSRGKTCVALQTDPRRILGIGNNPMIDCALSASFTSVSALLDWAREFVSGSEEGGVRKTLLRRARE